MLSEKYQEIEQILDLIEFKTRLRISGSEIAVLRKHVVQKYSYKEIVDGIIMLQPVNSQHMAVLWLEKILKINREDKANREQNLQKIQDLLKGMSAKKYGKK